MKTKLQSAIFKALLVVLGLFYNGVWGQVEIIPIRTDVTGFSSWTDVSVAGTTYLQLLTATSSSTTPAMDFNSFTSENLSFKARTFGGGNAVENVISVSVSVDNGVNWSVIGTRTPASSTMTDMAPFDLSSYNGTQVKVRFTVGGTSNTVGAGIDDILISGFASTSNPTILFSPVSMPNFGSVNINSVSANNSFTVSGSNLTNDITVTAPSSNFQLSLDEVAWNSSVVLEQSAGTVDTETVYVRFSPQAIGLQSGNITLESAGATTQTIAVSGTGVLPAPAATAGTLVTGNSFTANWGAVSGATSYEIDVYSVETGAQAADLIISEYVEGSSSNKAIEIYNGTGVAVNLSSYSLRKQANGSGSYASNLALSGMLQNGETYIVAHTSASSSILALADQTSSSAPMDFNGNDAVALFKSGVLLDEVGVFNQVANWGIDVTLRRKSTVNSPIATYNTGEWNSFSTDTFNGLGTHTFDGGPENLYILQNHNVGNVTSFEVTGLQEGTEYFYVVRAVLGADSANSNIISVTTTTTSTTWNGTVWSNGAPTVSLDAIIATDYATASNGTFTAKSLTVDSGVFTVSSGTSITVENAIVNNAGTAGFIVENNANVIQTNDVANTGGVTVKRNSAQLVRLDHTLWSSPVTGQNLFGFSPNTLTNRFYTYQTATDNYVNTGLTAATQFSKAQGYGVRAPNNHPTTPTVWAGSFEGVLNNGNATIAISNAGTGFNLVGNPYPSVIDASSFVSANANIQGTLYFYAHTLTMDGAGNFPAGTNYALWNGSGSTAATLGTSGVPALVSNGKIQVGQGFLIQATAAGNALFNNGMREANFGNQFFRTNNAIASAETAERHRIWLNLTDDSQTSFNQILVAYATGATQGFDRDFDGLAFGNNGSALSSRINGADYTIQGRALPFNATDVVPLGFKAVTSGNYTISLSQTDGLFAEDQDVFLKDNTTGAVHNLKSSDYTFTATEGTFNNRFEVVYQSALGIDESLFNSSAIVAYTSNGSLNIQTKAVDMKSVSVFDVRGRLIYQKSGINSNLHVISDLSVQKQVLLVQVTSENNDIATVKVIF